MKKLLSKNVRGVEKGSQGQVELIEDTLIGIATDASRAENQRGWQGEMF